jgi:U3 small nucleolar RNA-associated protein 5
VLAQRARLRDGLEALQGRLEMALAQVEMGRARVRREGPVRERREAARYVEGESSSSDEEEDGDVVVEEGEDEGSVEEVELGGSEDESGSEDDEEEEEEEDSEGEGMMNGFVDDEAEEYSGESDSASE